jgi:hypothetical protein
MQEREARQAIIFQAEMRGKGAWRDCTVHNISPHGMLILAADPPKPGAYIEIRKASLVLVGRAVWVNGKAFGVRLVERLPFMAVLKAANDSYAAESSGAPPSIAKPSDEVRPVRDGWIVALGLLALAAICVGVQVAF